MSHPAETVPSAAEALSSRVRDEVVSAEQENARPRRRRVWLPLMLFLATCLSTFWVGANQWFPLFQLWSSPENAIISRQMVLVHWQDGLIYMVCVLGILLTHEMGHFLATVRYRVPASFPFVLPMPLLPLGTLGAVIAMDGRKADRKEIFDIGIAGPLAGLVVAVPITYLGVQQLDLSQPGYGQIAFHNPLFVEMLMAWLQPPGYSPNVAVHTSQLNPYFMAGWVGMIITGLNMLPVSQLDGGHVIYTLFGKYAKWIARTFVAVAMIYVAYTFYYTGQPQWVLMLGLVFFIGVDHPPTRDDSVPIGWFRFCLGLLSLLIPVLCFAPNALSL